MLDDQLTPQEQQILLQIARQSIEQHISQGEASIPPREEKRLNQRRGCFVTLKKRDRLRGCIGNFQSELPLFREVTQMAIASATKDPRFYPMVQEDLTDFQVQISVLSPLQKIDDVQMIQVGEHGIYLEKGFYRGVLLPQVATENHWDRETFLNQTCIKAGLPTTAWQAPDTDIYIFSAQIFSEED